MLREFSPEHELVSQALRELEEEAEAIQRKVAADEARREELRRAEEEAQRAAAERALAERKAREDKERAGEGTAGKGKRRLEKRGRRKRTAQNEEKEQAREESGWKRRGATGGAAPGKTGKGAAASATPEKKEESAAPRRRSQRAEGSRAPRKSRGNSRRRRRNSGKGAEDAQRQKQEDERRRRIEEARASQAAAAAAQKPVATDENVQFTVFRRSAIQPEQWYPLLVFAHLADRRPDAPPDEPDPIEEVQAQARQLLGEDMGDFRSATEDSGYPVAREGELRFVPHMEGVTFNPPERRFLWTESVHREDFRMRADRSMDGRVARGAVSVFNGNLLLAEVQLSIKVDRKPAESHHEETHARPYRRIFASYSHRDTAIVEEFESHAAATGDRYLRDVVSLRAGEVWDQRLLEMIKQADVFQLFWSWNALKSPLVREEWRQALALNRAHFIRPVYWEEPLPEQAGLPPAELRRLHFQRVYPRVSSPALPPALPSPARERRCIPALEPPPDLQRAPISRLISYGSAAAVLVAAVGLYFTVLNGPPAVRASSAPSADRSAIHGAERGGAVSNDAVCSESCRCESSTAATAIPPSAAVKPPPPAPSIRRTTERRRGRAAVAASGTSAAGDRKADRPGAHRSPSPSETASPPPVTKTPVSRHLPPSPRRSRSTILRRLSRAKPPAVRSGEASGHRSSRRGKTRQRGARTIRIGLRQSGCSSREGLVSRCAGEPGNHIRAIPVLSTGDRGPEDYPRSRLELSYGCLPAEPFLPTQGWQKPAVRSHPGILVQKRGNSWTIVRDSLIQNA